MQRRALPQKDEFLPNEINNSPRKILRVLVLTMVFFVGALFDMLLVGYFPSVLFDMNDHRLGQLMAKPILSAVPFLLGGSFLLANGVYRTGALIAGFPIVCMFVTSFRVILNCLQSLL